MKNWKNCLKNSLEGGEITMKKENDPSIEEQQEELKEAVLNDKDKKK